MNDKPEYDTILKLQQKSYTPWVPAKQTSINKQNRITIETKTATTDVEHNFDAKSFYSSVVGLEDKSTDSQPIVSAGIAQVFDKYYKSDVKPPVVFELSSESPGFKMLTKMGWTGEHGLGPTEKNQHSMLYPVPTQFKLDRTGIGSRAMLKLKPRVTHFASRKYDTKGDEIVNTETDLIVNNDVKRPVIKPITGLLKKKSVVKQLHRKEKARFKKIQHAVLGRDEVPE
jgi:hypothetical protein